MQISDEIKRQLQKDIRRGDIYYVENHQSVGCEQRAGRPAVVVSNDMNNQHSTTVEIVYLTTQPKTNLPTHTAIAGLRSPSITLCEQITTVSVERLGNYCGHVTDAEMEGIDAAMRISLGLKLAASTAPPPAPDTGRSDAEVQCEMLQKMYDTLIDKLIKAM